MLVEAAWAVARSPGPLRAFFQGVASRRGKHIAAVATARKLTMIIWHMLTKSTDYIWTRPALLARKFRSIELRAGLPTSHAKRGSAYDYNIPGKRAEERARVESAEKEYLCPVARIVDEIHRPGLVRSCRRPAIIAQLGLDPALGRSVAQLQAQFAIDAPRLVLAMAPAFTTQQDVNTAVAVADANMADFLDLLFEVSLAGATGLVVMDRAVKFESVTGPADRDLPFAADLVDSLRFRPGFIANAMVCPAEPAHTARRVFDRERTRKMLRNKPQPAAVFGIDIGKNVFHVVATDARGRVIQKVKLRRDTLLQFFDAAQRTAVAMEACPGSQWLARKLQELGHVVRVIPAQFVKPYVKSNKNDIIDAEAIAEAATRPAMRFVEIKSEAQVDIQALHRIRDQKVGLRTQLVCQMRAFCLDRR